VLLELLQLLRHLGAALQLILKQRSMQHALCQFIRRSRRLRLAQGCSNSWVGCERPCAVAGWLQLAHLLLLLRAGLLQQVLELGAGSICMLAKAQPPASTEGMGAAAAWAYRELANACATRDALGPGCWLAAAV
jgi:hypothetical protein